ncbi:DUF6695 family protein [Carboxylicivirga sp. N1Y90]|uniref:DUF6695 family protein n=1 Tax=Carboxylicivirga fragile TaxID=3417571 RepID=UPI003D35846C|nr:hypothetical protein [Marinilabiliaceae bacterium N1Y90]
MTQNKKHTGFAIAIAWPETFCKQPGYWYDNFCNAIGLSKNHYYKVGHAALVLINGETKTCHYFDFGRYHTPFQHGRVRGELTDHKLKMSTRAIPSVDGKSIRNFEEILTELQHNAECHGEGAIHASYCSISFESGLKKVKQMQAKGPIPYGPFKYGGSNCSRFVQSAILAGKPNSSLRLKLKYAVYLTPTPLNNVNALHDKKVLPKLLKTQAFCPVPIKDKTLLKQTLIEPTKPNNIPTNSQWLSGEGAGSWFALKSVNGEYHIIRFSPDGQLECDGFFEIKNGAKFDLNKPYQFVHLSHCQTVKIKQSDKLITFERSQPQSKS